MSKFSESGALPPLPDFIKEKLIGKEFVKANVATKLIQPRPSKGRKHRVADDGVTSPSQSWMPASLKAAIVTGDYQALAKARWNNQNDLQANLTTISDSTDQTSAGFVTAINQSDGQEYRICASDAGWIWSYTVSLETTKPKADGDPPTTQCVVQTGSYSKNGQILGLSYQTLQNLAVDITALAASVIVSLVVGNMVKSMLTGLVYEAALSAAVAAAESGAVAGGFMASGIAVSIGTFILSGLAAGVVGALVAVIVFYIADFLYRSYGLTVQVYNWDTKEDFNVASWYADNATVAQGNQGSGPWQAACLAPVQNSVPGPLGPITTTTPVAQYATYCFQNDNEWAEGLGLAMQVSSSSSNFYFGYQVLRFSHNLLGMSSNASQSISDWYNNSDSWQPSGSYSYNGSIDGRPDLTVTIITDALDGNDRSYNCDVHIGLAQSAP